MTREKSFPSTQAAVFLVYISLGKGQWFSLNFSLSQENDDEPKSLEGQQSQV